MPKTPKFFDRVKDVVEKLRMGQPPGSAAPGQATEPVPESVEPEPDAADPGFAQRLKNWVQNHPFKRRPSPAPQQVVPPLLDPKRSLDMETIKYRIRYAGANRTKLYMKYNGHWRMVEPYSYRARGQKDANGHHKLMFFGFCLSHDKIHMFDLDRIEGLLVTDETFTPQWTIEVA